MLLVDLEPDGAITGEGLRRLTTRGLGHVELHGTRVLDATVDAETHCVACVDILGLGPV